MFSCSNIVLSTMACLLVRNHRRNGCVLLRSYTWYLRSECIRVSLEYCWYCFFSYWFIFHIVTASIAIAILAILSTCETFAIQLQTSGILAVAVLLASIHSLQVHLWAWEGRCDIHTRRLQHWISCWSKTFNYKYLK